MGGTAVVIRQRAIVFDMCGTLIDDSSAVYTALSKVLGGRDMTKFRGMAKTEVISRCCLPSERDAKLNEFNTTLASMYQEQPPKLVCSSIVDQLSAYRCLGIKVGLTTGFSSAQQNALISQLDLLPYLDGYVASDKVGRGRPHPDMLKHLMNEFGIKSGNDLVKVGDTPIDMEEGRSVGCTTVGVTSGGTPASDLWEAGANYVCSDVTRLPIWLVLGKHTDRAIRTRTSFPPWP
jgi:phosphoglycolate phosphatase-like HAD superfamily hydrolase